VFSRKPAQLLKNLVVIGSVGIKHDNAKRLSSYSCGSDAVALLIGCRTCELQVAGSGWAPLRSGLGQVTYTCVPLSPSSLQHDLFGWENNHEPGGKQRQPTTGFMTNVICELTAKKPVSDHAQRS